MADKLTPKQEKYVQGLFAGLSQREAYKQAYSCKSWKDKSIDEKACILAKNVKISSRLAELQDELKNRNMVTAEKILAEYAKIGFADLKDYLEYKTAKTVVDHDEDDEPIIDYGQIVNVIDSAEVDTSPVQEVSIARDGTFKFKMYDKKAALDSMAKCLGMFKDNINIAGNVPVKIVDDIE